MSLLGKGMLPSQSWARGVLHVIHFHTSTYKGIFTPAIYPTKKMDCRSYYMHGTEWGQPVRP